MWAGQKESRAATGLKPTETSELESEPGNRARTPETSHAVALLGKEAWDRDQISKARCAIYQGTPAICTSSLLAFLSTLSFTPAASGLV